MTDEFDNIHSVVKNITTVDGENEIVIYTPSTNILQGVTLKYYGLINTLRLNSSITSLTPVELDELDPAATPAEVRAFNLALLNQPRKGIKVLLRKDGVDAEIADIGIYPNRPRYMVNIIGYFTELQLYGIAHNTSIIAKIYDVGWGLLQNNDWVTITGSIIEKTNVLFDTQTQTPINLIF